MSSRERYGCYDCYDVTLNVTIASFANGEKKRISNIKRSIVTCVTTVTHTPILSNPRTNFWRGDYENLRFTRNDEYRISQTG